MHAPKIPKPIPPPPVPTIDTAVQMRNNQDAVLRSRRGAATSLLTSPNGLPDLGATSSAAATGA